MNEPQTETAAGPASPGTSAGAAPAPAPKPPRWRAAILVTTLSIAIAEVGIGSQLWGVIVPLNWILLVPLYGLQVLLLAKWAFAGRRYPSFAALWSIGVIMGLYEFYVTGVLWDSPWDDKVGTQLVDWFALSAVAGVYHPIFSVILPLVLADRIMAREPRLAGVLPWKWGRPRTRAQGVWAWVLVVVIAVICGGYNSPHGPVLTALGLAGTLLVVWLVVRWAARGPKVEHLGDAMPSRAGTVWSLVIVVVFHAIWIVGYNTTFALNDHLEPPVSGERQVAAWALYAVMFFLAARNLRHRMAPEPVSVRIVPVGWASAVVFLLIATVSSLPGIGAVGLVGGVLVIWYAGVVFSLTMLVVSIVGAFRKRRNLSPAASE